MSELRLSVSTRLFKLVFAALVDPSGLGAAMLAGEFIDFLRDWVSDKGKAEIEALTDGRLDELAARIDGIEAAITRHGLKPDEIGRVTPEAAAGRIAASLKDLAAEDTQTLARLFALLEEFSASRKARELLKRPKKREWTENLGFGALLDERYEMVPFTGRREEIAEMEPWCDGPEPVAVRLYWGPGGMGKTRFMRHMIEHFGDKGWQTGLLAGATAEDDSLVQLVALPQRLFVVIDYADSRVEVAKALIIAAAEHGKHVRIVLLARQQGEWWKQLAECHRDSHRLLAVKGAARPLAPLASGSEERRAEFDKAAQAFATCLGRPCPQSAPDLSPGHFAQVLFIHMAALLTVLGSDVGDENAILDDILAHEKSHLTRHAERLGLAPTALIQAAAATTLAYAAPGDHPPPVDAKAAAAALLAGLPRLKRLAIDLESLADALHVLYPAGDGRWLAGVQPDRLGERLVEQELADSPTALPNAVIEAGGIAAAHSALTVLARIHPRHPGLAETAMTAVLTERLETLFPTLLSLAPTTGPALPDCAATVLATTEPAAWMVDSSFKLPEKSISLRRFAAELTAKALVVRPANSDDKTVRANRATLLNNLAVRLSYLGRREEALAAIEEAVTLRRILAEANADVFAPDLSSSLNNLSNHLSDLGRREEALAAIEEAVTLRRAMVAANADAFTPVLASSLNNLANRLSDLGRREEALAPNEEAVEFFRSLADANADAFTPDLATSLNNLTNHLSDLGRREEALVAAEEAADLTRTLAATNADAFTPDLARVLNNLSNRLSDLGRWEEALAAIEEAVTIRRALAAANADAFAPDLAKSLIPFANSLAELGRPEEALSAAEESVTLHRALAGANADAFTPDLAMSLSTLANSLAELGRREEALAANKEAVALYRALTGGNADAFTPYLAKCLNNLAIFLDDLDLHEETVKLTRALADVNADAFAPDLAKSLNNLAMKLARLGRRDEALAAAGEAVTLRRALASTNADAFGEIFARSCLTYAHILSGLERHADAVNACAEGMRVLLPQARRWPQALGGLLGALHEMYSVAAEAANIAVDEGLLAEVVAVLKAGSGEEEE